MELKLKAAWLWPGVVINFKDNRCLGSDLVKIIRENCNLRQEVEKEIIKAFEAQNKASLMLSEQDKELVTTMTQQKLSLMSVPVILLG